MRAVPALVAALAALAAGAPGLAEPLSEAEERIVELVNGARAAAGLEPVVADEALCRVARNHAREMVEAGYFSHLSPRAGSPADRLRAARISFRLSGENIALDRSADGAHQALMESPGHRRNVLDPEFTHLGVGVVETPRGLYVTEHFISPGPGFAATAPEPSVSRRAEAAPRPRAAELAAPPASGPPRPGPEPASASPFDPSGSVPEPPPYWPAPVFEPGPASPPFIWIVLPGGAWQAVPVPFAPLHGLVFP